MATGVVQGATDYVDGNVLAGPLAAIFVSDVTIAVTTCVGCGRSSRVAELYVYARGPGMVARCPGCSDVVIRYASTSRGVMLDLRGAVAVLIAPQ